MLAITDRSREREHLPDDADLHPSDDALFADHEAEWLSAVAIELDHFLVFIRENTSVTNVYNIAILNLGCAVAFLGCGDFNTVLTIPIQSRSILTSSLAEEAKAENDQSNKYHRSQWLTSRMHLHRRLHPIQDHPWDR